MQVKLVLSIGDQSGELHSSELRGKFKVIEKHLHECIVSLSEQPKLDHVEITVFNRKAERCGSFVLHT
jgi:hypothetical protein